MPRNIFDKYKTCYIHIPKTGGTTIEHIIRKNRQKKRGSEHLPIEKYKDYYHYYIFSIVRNPYTRIISVYNYYKQGGNQSEHDINLMNKDTSLCDFLIKYNSKKISHLRTQFSFLKNSTNINYIGKFEKFEDEVKKICEILKIEVNKIPNKRNSKYINNIIITPKFINLVNKIYREDFINYNYKMLQLKESVDYNDFKKMLN